FKGSGTEMLFGNQRNDVVTRAAPCTQRPSRNSYGNHCYHQTVARRHVGQSVQPAFYRSCLRISKNNRMSGLNWPWTGFKPRWPVQVAQVEPRLAAHFEY